MAMTKKAGTSLQFGVQLQKRSQGVCPRPVLVQVDESAGNTPS